MASRSLGSSVILASKLLNCDEYKRCEEVLPVQLLKILHKYLTKSYVGNPVRLAMGVKGFLSLCIFQKSI